MQDHDFDNLFSQKMGQVAGKPPTEGEWTVISERLDARDRRRSRMVLPVLLPLFALLAGGNIFWWQAWRSAEQRFSEQKNTVTLADTVVRRTVIFQTDTIYKTVEIRRRVQNVFEKNSRDAAGGLLFSKNETNPTDNSNPIFSKKQPAEPTTPPTAEVEKLQSKIAELEAQNRQLKSQNEAAAMPATTSFKTEKNQADTVIHIHRADDSLFQNLLAQREIEKSRRQPRLFLAAPDVGISAGIGSPRVPGKISGFGRELGLSGSVEVARGLRVFASFDRQTTSLKSDDVGILPPAVVPNPGSDFKLKYWETYKMVSWEWATGLRYEWHNRLIFKPFVGLSLRQWRVRPFDTEFEFVNDINSIELHVPVEIENQKPYLGLSASVGGNVWLSRRMGFAAEVFWRSGEQRQVLPSWFLGLDTRFFYRFGK